MQWNQILKRTALPFLRVAVMLGIAFGAGMAQPGPSRAVLAAATIFASPIQAGCYQVRADRCKIHLEPFAIQLSTGEKLVSFQVIATRMQTGQQTVIYDFHPDISNPVPFAGDTFTPSLVAQDFAAACTTSYRVSLQGRDSGDASTLNLGETNTITCPKGNFTLQLPLVAR